LDVSGHFGRLDVSSFGCFILWMFRLIFPFWMFRPLDVSSFGCFGVEPKSTLIKLFKKEKIALKIFTIAAGLKMECSKFDENSLENDGISLFLCGDVMLGRGIDQILPNPSKPILFESYVRDANDYVRLAERKNGPLPKR
jgi:hypothetical protein